MGKPSAPTGSYGRVLRAPVGRMKGRQEQSSCAPPGRAVFSTGVPVGVPLPAVVASHRLPSLAPLGPQRGAASVCYSAGNREEPPGSWGRRSSFCVGGLSSRWRLPLSIRGPAFLRELPGLRLTVPVQRHGPAGRWLADADGPDVAEGPARSSGSNPRGPGELRPCEAAS